MQISSKRLWIEAAAGTAIVLAGTAVASGAPHLGIGKLCPHPVWLVVLALSARYGVRGLVASAPVAWGALALLGGSWRTAPALALKALATPSELGALAGALIVGWIASVHERHAHALEEKLEGVAAKATRDAAALGELRQAALALRARNDRLDLSLTFLRDVARKIERGDRVAAAEAALSLIVARLGARAAAVELASSDSRPLSTLASAGAWHAAGGSDVPDATVAEALRSGRPVRAVELTGAGPTDSDLAAPIVLEGVSVGVLVARGAARMGAAALRDLAVVAEWLAPAFDKARSGADGGALGGGRLGQLPASDSEPTAIGPADGEAIGTEGRGLSLVTI
ncbi:MAG TPA: hypothetical protein VLT58_12875 [Polyangia bacterium]|nr:hypothetical protein [Polyangia bacterium]